MRLCVLPMHAGKVVAGKDTVVFMSNSGNTPECVAAAHNLLSRGACTLVITGGQGECIYVQTDTCAPHLPPMFLFLFFLCNMDIVIR